MTSAMTPAIDEYEGLTWGCTEGEWGTGAGPGRLARESAGHE